MQLTVWIGFIVFVMLMLAADLGIFHRGNKVIRGGDALRWTAICAILALLFNGFVYALYEYRWGGFAPASNLGGETAALMFFTGWVVEQSLSLDNVFVIALIFSYFKIPGEYQHRVLFWGILGALVMRGIMIAVGAALIATFSWIHYVFGALLLYAAIKVLLVKAENLEPEHNPLLKLAKLLYPVSHKLDGEKFFTKIDGKRAMTPLFLVLLIVESTDVLFAVDSIPAVFAITEDPFLVFTSNIFAILSLRSLYFALAALMNKFSYLKIGLVVILVFVALKMLLSHHYPIPAELTFIVIVGSLAAAIGFSLMAASRRGPDEIR